MRASFLPSVLAALSLTVPQLITYHAANAAGFSAAESGYSQPVTKNPPNNNLPKNAVPNSNGASSAAPISYSVKKNATIADLDVAWKRALSQAHNVKYSHKGDNWFVIAGTDGGNNYYIKSRFSNPDHTLRSFIAQYPKGERRRMDQEVREFSRKFR